jgi:isocitrate/isopropylmalate dehydrogenase
MVKEGRAQFADPASMIRAAAMLLSHIGFPEKGKNLEMALDICGQYEKKLAITGRSTGATGTAFTDYLMDTLQDPKLKGRWEAYVKA